MRVDNFGAGPCTLPLHILEEAQAEFLDFDGSGMSILELSHRSSFYERMHEEALWLAREVSGAPDDFEVLVIAGGATMQFAMIPANLLTDPSVRGAYLRTGTWGRLALADAGRWGDAYCAWDGEPHGYRRMPEPSEIRIEPETRYLHVTSNETIGGIRMSEMPALGVPVVADVSSDFMARPIPWELCDLVYGGVQKNLAPAGMALVFIRRGILDDLAGSLPRFFDYRWYAAKGSTGNTPPVFPIYMMGKMLKLLKGRGGVTGLQQRTAAKAGLIYDVIDRSDGYYRNPVDPRHRSHTNVVFRLPTPEAETQFLAESNAAGLVGLKGHRSVGGCRASLYAGLQTESVARLASFMSDFRAANS